MSYVDFENKIIDYIMSNYDESLEIYRNIERQVDLSDLHFNGRSIQTLAVPKIFSAEDMKHFEDFIPKCFSVFNKVIDRYINDTGYRKLFPFSKELEELILLPGQYDVHIPMSRVDFFFDEETKEIKLCEINTDGTSAMNEVRIFLDLLPLNKAFNHVLGDNYYAFELFDTWVKEFMKLWNEYSMNKPDPMVAIIDFLDKATLNEFKRYKEAFERNGISCLICDIRELDYDGKNLSHKGEVISAVYRRAVTSDIMENFGDVQPFIKAARDNNVCIVGGFKTQIIHNKASFTILHKEETKAFMSEEERAFIECYVPLTKELSRLSADEENIYDNKDSWIIKPFDLYASKGVYAGIDYTPEKWRTLVSESIKTGEYLMQEFNTPYRSKNIDFTEEHPEVRSYCNMTCAFCYNEKLYAMYSRLSKENIIIPKVNEKVIATVIA